jgi:hypothetical protein
MGRMRDDGTVGALLHEARIGKGLSREILALELKLPVRHIEAIEADDWEALPPGRARPLARQLAERLGVDRRLRRRPLPRPIRCWGSCSPRRR